MSTNVLSRIVTFEVGDDPPAVLHLKLEQPWKRSVGIEPDVNFAMVRTTELAPLLTPQSGRIIGDVNFFFTDHSEAVPDVSLSGIELISMDPSDYAIDQSGAPLATTYRLGFADRRNQFVWPRGGYLYSGEVNTKPVAYGTDANGNEFLNPQQLAIQAATAMGYPSATVPNSLSDMSPIYNLEWRGAHAPTELAKIVHSTGHCIYCDIDGYLQIAQIGQGTAPDVPPNRSVMALPFPSLDRRPSAVVFSSAPNQSLVTTTISGFGNDQSGEGSGSDGDDGDSNNSLAAWEFVIQDDDGSWQTLNDVSYFQGQTPIDEWNQRLPNLPLGSFVQVAWQMYRCVRLNRSNFGPSPILRQIVEQRENSTDPNDWVYSDIEVMASIAIANELGLYYNQTTPVNCRVLSLEADGMVIQVAELLLKLANSPANTMLGNAVELDDDDFAVRITRESFVAAQNGTGAWIPDYNHVGFAGGSAVPQQLSPGDVQGYLSNPDAIVVRRPDFRLLTVDGNAVNGNFISNSALNSAPAFLAPSSGTSTKQLVTGFFSVELGGLVSKVIYDQNKLMTTIDLNTHWLPSASFCSVAMEQDKPGKGEKFPKHAATIADRSAEGSTTQPTTFLNPSVPDDPQSPPLLVKVTGYAGGGKYLLSVISGYNNATNDGSWLNEGSSQTPDPGLGTVYTDGTNTSATILGLNLFEDAPFTFHTGAAANLQNILPINSYHLGRMATSSNGAMIVELESSLFGGTTTVSIGTNTSSTQETAMTDSVEVADRQVVMLTFLSRVAYNASSEKSFLAFYRVARFAGGRLTDVSTEGSPITVFTTAACS